jgi:23S rRNA (cytidine1920-2'-O)/16S rRNA (cytidine1409-2'-O)-methyltransferase
MRLDQRVAEVLWVSRNRAQFFIEHELVRISGEVVRKMSLEIKEDTHLEIDESASQIRFVSRSAQKLDDFLEMTKIMIQGITCLDIGASTGGFTQVLLERGAERVTAIDVGTLQLHERLRSNPKICSLENTDIRHWQNEEQFGVITIDVSFISVREVLPAAFRHLESLGICVVLFKPQFEVGPDQLKKSGIPKSESIRLRSIQDFCSWLAEAGIVIVHQQASTLFGEAGNQEVLFALQKS